MFLTLNDMLGKVLLAVALGVATAFMLSPFWEFGATWHQCQEDVKQYQRRAGEKSPVGFLNGRTYYSQEEFAADLQQSHQEHAEKWIEYNERMLQDIREKRANVGLGH